MSERKLKSKDAAVIYGITQRRAQQLAKEYRETGRIPVLKSNRRPRTYLTDEQKEQIDKAWDEARLGAKLLYYELKRRGYAIPKNKIHQYLRETGKTIPNPKKQKKRKRCRYERKHSGSLIHGDWHENDTTKEQVIVWLDDASRKVLAGGEFKALNTANSKATLLKAIKHAGEYNLPIRQVNTDRGSEFFANKTGKKGKGVAEFEKFLTGLGIRHIPSRVKNPQTNGKLERFFQEYEKHRNRFNSFDEFAEWYNNRLHGALWLKYGETPNEAFQRKLPPESMLGLFYNEEV